MDLLIDTVCNAFGGIILIAVLIAVLGVQAGRQMGDGEDVERSRINLMADKARRELDSLMGHIKELEGRRDDAAIKRVTDFDAIRVRLAEQVAAARSRIWEAKEKIAALEEELAVGRGQKVEELAERKRNAQEGVGRVSMELAALEAQLLAADSEFEVVVSECEMLERRSRKTVRLPRERGEGQPEYVIVKGREVFPVRFMHGEDWVENNSSIHWEHISDGKRAEPIIGRGWGPRKMESRIRQYIRSVRQKGTYIAFLVFEDSFPEFITCRDWAIEEGVGYGWDAYQMERPVGFSVVGTTPPAL